MEMYLETREGDLREQTHTAHRYRLTAFVRWCEAEGFESMDEVGGRDLHTFRSARRDGFEDYDEENMGGYDELTNQTLHNQLSTLRVFLRFCSQIDAVADDLASKIILPKVRPEEEVSDSTLDPARAASIVEYLDRYHYASRDHVVMLLLWHLGCRTGAIRGIDLEDLDLEGDHPKTEGPAIHLVHRGETPLKNGSRGERWNAISNYVAQVVEDYIDGPREDVVDDVDRDPLLTTSQGRPVHGTIRNTIYRLTRPCWRGEECPHDRDPDTCDATTYAHASECPSSRSPHDVRSGSLTRHLLDGTPRDVVQERMNVSEQVLDQHYDRRTAREKMEQRRRYLPDQ